VEEKGEAVEKNDFDNSINTIRYRVKDGKLQGNTLLNKWSDGSYTLSIGDEIFELLPNPLAPPRTEAYQALLDSHQYVGVPYGAGSLMQIVGHLTNEFKVSPSERIRKKEAARILEKARTAGRSSNAAHGGIAILTKVEDPELQRKKAEVAEREQARNARRLESARSKQDGHSSRIRGAMGGGLTLDDLEGRSRPSASKTKRAAPAGRRKPRREDYDTDDEMPRGRNREDEYDMEDDFLVDDEDEEEAAETGESEEEEEYERHSPKAKKQKREATPLSDEDAEGEEDEGAVPISSAPTTQGGRARRQVIDSDDDE
jgi:RNA polymerase-associated protein LEO1